MTETALGLRFQVKIDGFGSLGNWTKCDGLGVAFEIEEIKEGGQNGFIHKIPGHPNFDHIRLTRPIDKDSEKVTAWVGSLVAGLKYQTAEITVLDAAGETVATWNLLGVFPARWSGPTLDVNGNQVASETLELAHLGFLPAGLPGR